MDCMNSRTPFTASTKETSKSSFLPEFNTTLPLFGDDEKEEHSSLQTDAQFPSYETPIAPTKTACPSHTGHSSTAQHSSGHDPNPPLVQLIHCSPNYNPDTPKARFHSTPALPTNWTEQHDRAICLLDVRNYSLTATVIKMRRAFPELYGMLTAAMIDRRLRQLDQDIEKDYWRVGLQHLDAAGRTGSLVENDKAAEILKGPRLLDGADGPRNAGSVSPLLRVCCSADSTLLCVGQQSIFTDNDEQSGTPIGVLSPSTSTADLNILISTPTLANLSSRNEMVTHGFLTGFLSYARV